MARTGGWRLAGVLLAGLGGCVAIQDLAQLIEPRVAQVVAIDVPLDVAEIEGSAAIAEQVGTWVGVRLFDADAMAATGEIEVIDAASVQLIDQLGEVLWAEPMGGGEFELGPVDLPYVPGEQWEVEMQFEGREEAAVLPLALPPAPLLELVGPHGAGLELHVDLRGQGFVEAVVAVAQLGDGEQTHWEVPEDYDTIVAVTHGRDPLEGLVIPGTAFPQAGAYLVGVAGLAACLPSDADGLNPTLSGGLVGQLALEALVVEEP